MAYTSIDNPELFFQTLIWTGDGSGTKSFTLDGSENMQPDWVWSKARDSLGSITGNHFLYDSVRGAGAEKEIVINSASLAEGDNANQVYGYISSLNSNGFTTTAGSSNNDYFNKSSVKYVAWNWKAGGTAPAITYSVKVVSDSGNKYRFDDFGTSAVTLDLQEGGTYTFDLSDSSNDGHPMKFSETSNGSHGGGSTYSTGIVYQLDGASVTESNYVSNFNSASSRKIIITISASAPTLYYFCHYHSGMGGQANTNSTFGSSNFGGTIQSVASANVTSGFSVVTYTGTGSSATIGHGLGTTPSMVWIFKRDGSGGNAHVFHKSLGSTQYLLHASTLGVQTYAPVGIGSLTSSTFSVGTVSGVNGSGSEYIAYVFADTGNKFCKIDNYTGNGSTNGTYVECGFRPAWVFVKRVDSTSDWLICDNKRDPDNGVFKKLFPNTSAGDDNYESFDFYANGFKIRSSGTGHNASGANMLYMAFAESPFVNSNGVPSNAR